MKTICVFLLVATLCIAGINSFPQKRDVTSVSANTTTSLPDVATALQDIFTSFKKIIPCGDASIGLPILEPFRMPIVSLDINHDLLVLNGSIENMVLTGIGNYIIIELKTNATNNRTTYDILFRDIQLLGDYNLYVNADLAGYKLVLNLMGLMNLQIKDLRLNGGITIGSNPVGGILFSDVVTYVEVGNVISEILDDQWSVALDDFFNKYVQQTAMIYVKTRREFLNQIISAFVTETVNTAMYNVTLNEYIQGMVDLSTTWDSTPCAV